MTKGQGLNSIPVRFGLVTAVLTGICSVGKIHFVGSVSPIWEFLITSIAFIIPVAVVVAASMKLKGYIVELQKSTDAIASGDFERRVDVDCNCEIGGLADSFRGLVGRINSNILRMNLLAHTDAVTGLANRAVLQHILEYGLANERKQKLKGALLFIDLDGFKRINDTLGHEAGDMLLKAAADRIVVEGFGSSLEKLDTCVTPFGEPCERLPDGLVFIRFAGDEFVALIPGEQDRKTLRAISDQLLLSLEKPFMIKGNRVSVGASIGIARCGIDSTEASEVLHFADLAMYAAKRAGKGQARFFDKEIRKISLEHTIIESDLRHALKGDELFLVYQPKLDVSTMEIEGVETLVRWNHPERGLMAPDTFIPIAERNGLMPKLGELVLRMAVKQCREWADSGKPIKTAINVSPAQFEDPHFVKKVIDIVEEFDIDPSLLELEVTETMVMSDFSQNKRKMDALCAYGVVFSIDDFGIGFSNLSLLSKLPFSRLKIDRSLICDMTRNKSSKSIVRAVVQMAHALELETIAEGIEKPEEFEILSELGCDYLQGFLFAKPLIARELIEWQAQRPKTWVSALQQTVSQKIATSA